MKIHFSILILLLASLAQSNIRVGRTGGGLAEMKAYSVVAQLPAIIGICSAAGSRCGLTPLQRDDLLLLQRNVNLRQLVLVAPWSGVSRLNGLTLQINSQDLYTSGTPHGYGRILSLCLSLLLRDGLKKPEALSKWPYLVFESFRENMRSLDLSDRNFTLHALSLGIPRSNQTVVQALALERPQATEDLTEPLVAAFGCEPTTWSIEGWNYSNGLVRAQLLWTCGKSFWSGELQLLISLSQIERFAIVRRARLQ